MARIARAPAVAKKINEGERLTAIGAPRFLTSANRPVSTSLTQAPDSSPRPARALHVVHALPRDWSSLAHVLTPVVERIDPMEAAVQLLVITPDVESTVALVAGAFAHFGVQGIDVVPATSAQRAARLLRTDPARAVAEAPRVA